MREWVDQPTAVLRERVNAARAVIAARVGLDSAAVVPRVAASIVFLGLAARLISPPLGAAVLGGAVPELTLDALYWRPVEGGPMPLAIGAACARRVGDVTRADACAEAAELLVDRPIRNQLGPLVTAFQANFRLSPQVLQGNVASALGGAVRMLGHAYPSRAEAAARLAERMLLMVPLAGTGQLVQPDPAQADWFFVRRSCCLFYRVPGAGMCADCVLISPQVRQRQWQEMASR